MEFQIQELLASSKCKHFSKGLDASFQKPKLPGTHILELEHVVACVGACPNFFVRQPTSQSKARQIVDNPFSWLVQRPNGVTLLKWPFVMK